MARDLYGTVPQDFSGFDWRRIVSLVCRRRSERQVPKQPPLSIEFHLQNLFWMNELIYEKPRWD
jgi:hypothetical protein